MALLCAPDFVLQFCSVLQVAAHNRLTNDVDQVEKKLGFSTINRARPIPMLAEMLNAGE